MKKYLLLLALISCNSVVKDEVSVDKNGNQIQEKTVKAKLEPTVYFSYDSSSLSRDARRKLQGDVAWLQVRKGKKVVIEGHCDERGTMEYNLALGERRAYAVKRFLVNGGISSRRIKVISYGEEKPAVLGSSDRDYSLNRRAEIKIK